MDVFLMDLQKGTTWPHLFVMWGYLGLKCGDVFDLAIRAKNMGPARKSQLSTKESRCQRI